MLNKMIEYDSKNVIVKMKNGRVLSGLLVSNREGFTLKLGINHLELDPGAIAKISLRSW